MKSVFRKYLEDKGYDRFDLKAVLFDMDGVLYDSMKHHARSWFETSTEFGLNSTLDEFYMHEGRVGGETIDILYQRKFGRLATDKEKEEFYKRKTDLFTLYNENQDTIAFSYDILKAVKSDGLQPVLVTGSGQHTLLNKLENNFPGMFRGDMMVTAYDVENGKPNPEPYLKGLKKAGDLSSNQAIVVENAPMGVESAIAAKIFTIAVNTGPLPDHVLWDAGANIVLDSMEDLVNNWPMYKKELGLY